VELQMSTYASYQLRLWRKHLMQHQVLLDLSLPELGLYGGESAAEEALLSTLLKGLGVPLRLRAEAQRRYGNEAAKRQSRRDDVESRSDSPGSFYMGASRLFSLFEGATSAAGAVGDAAFEAVRERMLFQTLLDLGVFYGIYGHDPMREAVTLYGGGKGDFARGAPPEPPEGPLLREGDPIGVELHFEAFAHARRALRELGDIELGAISAISQAPAPARVVIHRFAAVINAVIGLPTKLSGALGFLQGTRLVDRAVTERLDALLGQGPPPDDAGLGQDVLAAANETVHRLRLAADTIEEAWRDGALDPEETLILRYALLHLFGLPEDAAGRYVGSREVAAKLVAALRASAA
jgi:hypothetical protein